MSTTTSKPKSKLDLSCEEDVLEYLVDTTFSSTRAEPLSGGYANFTFRLHLTRPFGSAGGARTLILKHAKAWAAADKEFALDVKRQDFEAIALRHVRAFLPSDSLATVPAVYYHDSDAHVIIMEDAGSDARNLKDLLRESPLSESASRELGTALGRFLAAVHVRGSADAELLEGVRKNDEGRRITSWITYARLVDTLKRSNGDAGVVEPPLTDAEAPLEAQLAEIRALADAMVKNIHEEQATFTMGDFWTGNIIVRLTRCGEIERIFVIDWELSKPGLSFIDFAQFTAEMHTLRRFHPEAGPSVSAVLRAYGEAYKQGAKVDEGFTRSAVSHVGAHMVTVTPGVKSWGPKEKVREVVKEGIVYVLGGLHRDSQWLQASAVGGLLSSTGT